MGFLFKRKTKRVSPVHPDRKIQNDYIEMLVLLLLKEHYMGTYQIGKTLRERSEDRLRYTFLELDPVLRRMVEEEYIDERYEEFTSHRGEQRVRPVYVITEKGKERFIEIEKQYDEQQIAIRQFLNVKPVSQS